MKRKLCLKGSSIQMKKQNQHIEANRRRHGRLSEIDMTSSLGRIINISAGGMVVLGRGVVSRLIEVEIGKGKSKITVVAESIWSARAGFFRRLTGLRFVDPPEHLLDRIYGTELTTRTNRVI